MAYTINHKIVTYESWDFFFARIYFFEQQYRHNGDVLANSWEVLVVAVEVLLSELFVVVDILFVCLLVGSLS
jgi:hypothetical protein